MPRPYPPEFRARAVALVRAGRQAKQTAFELGIHPVTLSNWIRQDDIDQGRRPGVPAAESAELRAAKRRIRELEAELVIVRQAAALTEDQASRSDLLFQRGQEPNLWVFLGTWRLRSLEVTERGGETGP